MAKRTTAAPRPPVTADVVLSRAARLIDRDGVDAFTMRGLADDLGVAVTSIYWHVGGRDALFDALVERLLAQMADLPVEAEGDDPVERIACLARSQRRMLIEKQNVLSIAHDRGQTPHLFLPVQRALAAQLAALGVTGTEAALILRAVQVHVISAAVMQFPAVRGAKREHGDPSLWADAWPDQELVDALQSPTDYDAVFEYGLAALLASLRDGPDRAGSGLTAEVQLAGRSKAR